MKFRSLGIVGVLIGMILPVGCGANAGDGDVGAAEQGVARRSPLIVPDAYATVQAAIDSAQPGAVIQIRPGTYREQLSIDKDLELEGAGAELTGIQAPVALQPGILGKSAIVEIRGAAKVKITKLAVQGPGPAACEVGSLHAGIKVIQGASLDLSFAKVESIFDTPKHDCNHNGQAIAVGDFLAGESGHANIHHVAVTGFQSTGITVFGRKSEATITDNVVDAAVASTDLVATNGISIGNGALAKVSRNVVRGALCNSAELGCGPDPITQFQGGGIGNGPDEPPAAGTEFDHNLVSQSDVGMYLAFAPDCCSVHHNAFIDNRYFGIAVQDSVNEVSSNLIVGGDVGAAAIADAVDSRLTLRGDRILRSKVAPTQELECCGFDAVVSR